MDVLLQWVLVTVDEPQTDSFIMGSQHVYPLPH